VLPKQLQGSRTGRGQCRQWCWRWMHRSQYWSESQI